ncbi:DUF432 domain-containing protein [candidate division KSB1 bacterium]|nr:DUF432 domain-containing protein [candidate division KSB1 bacterium]
MGDIKVVELPLSIWGEHHLEDGFIYGRTCGELRFWIRKMDQEIQIAYQHASNLKEEIVPSDSLEWARFNHSYKNVKIDFKPVFPDRSISVKLESDFWLIKDTQTRIYLELPAWIRIGLKTKTIVRLLDLPTKILSNTWFGDFFKGELCYWLKTSAKRDFHDNHADAYVVRCPVQLVNKSEEDLLVQKICLRVANMNIYIDDDQLWSEDITIHYEGAREGSQIKQSGRPPKERPDAALIFSGERATKKSFVAKTFSTLKEFPGLGMIID